jgi:hypothetical protein
MQSSCILILHGEHQLARLCIAHPIVAGASGDELEPLPVTSQVRITRALLSAKWRATEQLYTRAGAAPASAPLAV